MKHPKSLPSDSIVLRRLKAKGYRRLKVGEIRRATDVYALIDPIYRFTVGQPIESGDYIFRKVRKVTRK